MKPSIVLFLLMSMCRQSFAQQIDISIHARVDTGKKEIKEIATLWKNYLQSQPDSIYNNPYWNEAEKKLYKDFDLSRVRIYQFSSKVLLNYYKPSILSIEKEGDNYGIRTLFMADGLDGIYRKSNPWCITKLYAVKENNVWKLKNALPIITQKWLKKTVGKITFIYPASHVFNDSLAVKANAFCNKISNEFQFPDYKAFDFYITDSGDEMGKLLNFDYYFAGYTTGMGLNAQRILLSGMGSEYYPHEFMHLIVPPFERHGMIEEGFATWKGGQEGKSFATSVKNFALALSKNDSVTFMEVLHKQWGWQYSAYYCSGAVLCDYAYKKGGIDKVKALLQIPRDETKLIESLCQIFGIQKNDFDKFWRAQCLGYLKE